MKLGNRLTRSRPQR